MQYDLFISHSTQDRLIAETIITALREHGIACWIAPDNIAPGTSWPEAIVEAIDGCRAMLVILSDKSIKSIQVANELNLAAQAGRTIVPLRVSEVKLPNSMKYALATYQWVDVFPDVVKHLDKLAQDVRLLLAKLESTAPEVTLLAPSAGDAWPAGSQQTVRWNATAAGGCKVSGIRIDLRRGDRDERCIADTASGLTATNEHYVWQVPADLVPAVDYQLQITVVDDAEHVGCAQASLAIASAATVDEVRPMAADIQKAAPVEPAAHSPLVAPAAAGASRSAASGAPTPTSDNQALNPFVLLYAVVINAAFLCAVGGMGFELKEVVFAPSPSKVGGLPYAIPTPPSPPNGAIGFVVYALEKIFANLSATGVGLGRGLVRGGLFGAIVGSLIAIVTVLTARIASAVRRLPWQVVLEEFGDAAAHCTVAACAIAALAIFLGGYDWQYGGLGVGLVAGAIYGIAMHRELNRQRQGRLLGKA